LLGLPLLSIQEENIFESVNGCQRILFAIRYAINFVTLHPDIM